MSKKVESKANQNIPNQLKSNRFLFVKVDKATTCLKAIFVGNISEFNMKIQKFKRVSGCRYTTRLINFHNLKKVVISGHKIDILRYFP